MATRTSSPPASRSGNGSKTRSSGSQTRRKPSSSRSSSKTKRPAPRAVRNGPGPVATLFSALFSGLGRGLAAAWLGVAHAIGSTVRHIGHTARDLEPEHRRDGAGLFLIGTAVVVAAAVWWQLPGTVGHFTRTVVNGSVGLIGWFVPLLLVFIAVRNLRNPESNGPAGRQVIGWAALLLGVLGLVHIGNGMPEPRLGDTTALQQAGGALGFVIASLFMDLLRSAYVVVPLLVLLAAFGVLVITGTPVYQIPAASRARPAARPHDAHRGCRRRRGENHRAPAAPARPPRRITGRRRRPRPRRPALRQPRARGTSATQPG
jgi:S-DNA-T family DNA segregation ATPase FtsK/SpoIIIE